MRRKDMEEAGRIRVDEEEEKRRKMDKEKN